MQALLESPLFQHRVAAPESLRYGTAGFRLRADFVAPIAARLGPVFAERAAALAAAAGTGTHGSGGGGVLCFGVMVTASHNPAADNGLKIVEPPHAHMLNAAGEERATALARTADAEAYLRLATKKVAESSSSSSSAAAAATTTTTATEQHQPRWCVIVGWDTRESCGEIVDALALGVEAHGGRVYRAGRMSTPMLHWSVEVANAEQQQQHVVVVPPQARYLTERFECFSNAVIAATAPPTAAGGGANADESKSRPVMKRHLIVDCANGVGADVMKQLTALFAAHPIPGVEYTFELVNTDTANASVLNHQCGADYVQKEGRLPANVDAASFVARSRTATAAASGGADSASSSAESVILYSLDGDADRLVAGAVDFGGKGKEEGSDGAVAIIEGDRFTALFASILCARGGDGSPSKSSPSASSPSSQQQQQQQQQQQHRPLRYGCVQTAYANGSSTQYLQNCSGGVMKTEFALTGVKHVHHAAAQYDVGLYFESNGHGTVLVAPGVSVASLCRAEARVVASLCSQSCGDAVANLLATEFALIALRWSPQRWLGLYTDLPCVQKKVPVPNPALFTCADGNEQRLVAPPGLQEAIDDAVAKCVLAADPAPSLVRAFVRPSGTESVVRLYVEAPRIETAHALTAQLEALVRRAVE